MIDYKAIQDKYELNVYPKRDIVAIEGKNAIIIDDKGREFIDCISGNGVANIGHGNKEVASAIYEQAQKLITVPGIFYNDKRAELLEKLISISPENLHKAFLCNSARKQLKQQLSLQEYQRVRKKLFVH
jgi:acetylornithine/LysW-gamma-L-lysine aminotransferase